MKNGRMENWNGGILNAVVQQTALFHYSNIPSFHYSSVGENFK